MSAPLSTGSPAQLWQTLLRQSQERMHLRLGETPESYLVFTLIRCMRDSDLLARTMALDVLVALEQPGVARDEGLREVGDRCLLIAGLFPRRRLRARVDAGYYRAIGHGAYRLLAERRSSVLATVYAELAGCYGDLVRVLLGVRLDGPPAGDAGPITASRVATADAVDVVPAGRRSS